VRTPSCKERALDSDQHEPTFLDLLAQGEVIPARRIALVFAHPDDETIGAGAQLPRLPGLHLVQVTDGAPRTMGDAARQGLQTAAEYSAVRRRELACALRLAGVPETALVRLDVPDQAAALQLAELSRRLAALFTERGIEVVLTHAYEGGHPDHDAVAFAVHHARRLAVRRSGVGPTLVEMPFYHATPAGWTAQRFIPDPHRPELAIRLDEEQQALKRRMIDAHGTQRETLAAFTAELERFRMAPRHDFTILPNGGELLYERYDWGLDGARWRELAARALAELEREQAR
jgi:N-acetylglucosamine malate deacetylase 2